MNIFVANINFRTKKEDLSAAFGEFGEVTSVKIIRDRETGRSKGFGFVEMANDDEGQRAIEGMNGRMLDDRELVVKAANGRPTTPEG